MHFLKTLWYFSRPHTIIGSFVSVTSLFILAGREHLTYTHWMSIWLPSILSALLCNLYITGLNQWSDVEVDKINKPNLPIISGALSKSTALNIVFISGVLSLLFGIIVSPYLFLLVLLIGIVGTIYSLPPIKLKKHHLGAALAISIVRGLMVNLGFILVFSKVIFSKFIWYNDITPLVIFVVLFSLGIAWFKDIPDMQGDRKFNFGTLALQYGKKSTFLLGIIIVSIGYLIVMGFSLIREGNIWNFLFVSHGVLLLLFLFFAYRTNLENSKSIKFFYYSFWGFFFIEYIIYPLGIMLK
jgi:homogentisate phytyltransferase / homogentisate geranylgeranyltransferase